MSSFRPARLVSVLFVLTMTTTPASAATQEPEPRSIYMLMCDKVGVPLQITLDGVVLDRSDTLESSSLGAPLNSWIRAGKNAIHIQSLPGAKIAADAHFRCTVAKYGLEDVASSDDALPPEKIAAKYEWPEKGGKRGPAVDKTLELTIAEKDAPVCELWKRAEKLTLDEPTRAAVLKMYQDLEAALRTGDAARVIELHRFSGEDGYRCMGKPPQKWERDAGDAIRYSLKEMKGGKFQPWDPAKAKVELGAGGLVAQVSMNGAEPIVVVVEDGKNKSRSTFQPYLAKIDGKLVIVR
jgi:hypothetical protein